MRWIQDFYSSTSNSDKGIASGMKRVQNPVGMREGPVSVKRYMAPGKDLWEYSHVLPKWMKGRSLTIPLAQLVMMVGLGFGKGDMLSHACAPIQSSLSGTRNSKIVYRSIQKNGINFDTT